MLRGHIKSIAIYSLIAVLVGNPIMAATPGAASRQAAQRNSTARQSAPTQTSPSPSAGVQTALGLRVTGQRSRIQQVVGKQPSTPKVDPNRSLSLLPSLFGGTRQSSTQRGSSNRSSANRSSTHRATANPSPNSGASTRGVLSELFGTRTKSVSSAATPVDTPPPTVDWKGIPYHQARSQTLPSNPAPIRDPRPGETKLAGPSRLSSNRSSSNPDAVRSGVSPSIPKPPALAPAPSSRRWTPAEVVARTVTPDETPSLSPLSSSRRSGRRDVPTLDASEIAAAQKTQAAAEQQRVPKVARRAVKSEPGETAVAKSDTKPSTQPTAAKPAKTAPKTTPSAEVAINPRPKLQPEPSPQTLAQSPPSASDRPIEGAPGGDTPASQAVANDPDASPALAATTPSSSGQPSRSNEGLSVDALSVETPSASQPTATESPTNDSRPVEKIAAATQPPPPQQLPASSTTVAPNTPLFVPPQLPAPATPQFGTTGNLAGHRIGPPASAFRSRSAPTPAAPAPTAPLPAMPQAALNPAGVPFGPSASPVGSGITTNPPAAAAVPGDPRQLERPGDYQRTAQAPRVAQNPYPSNPHPYNGDRYGQVPTEPTTAPLSEPSRVPVTPHIGQSHPYAAAGVPAAGSALGAPMSPAPRSASPVAAPPQQTYSNQPSAAPAPSGQSRFADRPFQTPLQPRPNAIRAATSELPAGQSAVASELPGIRVVTHGPRSVIIRQTHEFEIRVENRGSIDATGVMVRARIPAWADIKGQSTSSGSVESQFLDNSDRLVWTIDSLAAGATEKLFVRLQALDSGTHQLDVEWTLLPLKSVAKIEVREPRLDLVIEGPETVVFGESQSYRVRVLNPGDGAAPNVVFTLSPNSSTPQTQRIGNIPSGKEAQFEVELTAQDLGDLKIHGLASGDLGLKAEAQKTIQVSAAELEAVLAGPEMKYQNTDASYHLELSNRGTATSKKVTASLALPPGVRYLGGIDAARQRGTKLVWEIESLPPGATRDYEFNCTMVSPGRQTFDFAAQGSAAGTTSVALGTDVESIADLVMTIQDPAAPAPVGSEVVYEILIKNRGSRQAQGVRAIAQFSEGIEPRRIEGHSGQVLTGQVLFDPIEAIRPGEQIRIRVIAEAEREGHHRFRTEIRSGETVLVAEEATQYLNKRGERVSRRSSSSSHR